MHDPGQSQEAKGYLFRSIHGEILGIHSGIIRQHLYKHSGANGINEQSNLGSIPNQSIGIIEIGIPTTLMDPIIPVDGGQTSRQDGRHTANKGKLQI